MAQNDNLNLQPLRPEIQEPVKAFAEKLTEQLADNLQSITIVGSSLTDDFQPGKSDINTVLIVGTQNMEVLSVLAGMAKSISKKKFALPLLMTEKYIERSSDVFGIEFLDLKLTHETISGSDPFESLSFKKADVRHQCERELKAMLIRLRQGYVAAAANKRLVRDILISTSISLAPLLRAMLWLKDIDRPKIVELSFAKAVEEFGVNVDFLIEVRKWKYEKTRLSQEQIKAAFESIYETVDTLATAVDRFEV